MPRLWQEVILTLGRFNFPEIITPARLRRSLKMDDQSLQGDHLCQSKLEFVSQKAEHPLRTLSVPGLEECAPRCWLRMPAEAAPQETPARLCPV